MSANFYSEDTAVVDAVLQDAKILHNEFMTKVRHLHQCTMEAIAQDPTLEQLSTNLLALAEIMRVDIGMEAKFDEALSLCNNPNDLQYLHDITNEIRLEKASLLGLIFEDTVSVVASNDNLSNEMKGFINHFRAPDCPECRAECNGGSLEELREAAAIENADILTGTSSNEEVAESFVKLFADMVCKKL